MKTTLIQTKKIILICISFLLMCGLSTAQDAEKKDQAGTPGN